MHIILIRQKKTNPKKKNYVFKRKSSLLKNIEWVIYNTILVTSNKKSWIEQIILFA